MTFEVIFSIPVMVDAKENVSQTQLIELACKKLREYVQANPIEDHVDQINEQ